MRSDIVSHQSKEYDEGAFGHSPFQTFISAAHICPPHVNIRLRSKDGTFPGPIIFTPVGTGVKQTCPIMLNEDGTLIWTGADVDEIGRKVKWGMNIKIQQLKGEPVITFWDGDFLEPGYGKGTNYVLNTSYELVDKFEIQNQPAGTTDVHEFLLTSRHTAIVQSWPTFQCDLTSVGGGKNDYCLNCIFQELDVDTKEVLFEWNALDHISLEETYASIIHPTLGKRGGAHDEAWAPFHMNSIDTNDDGDFLISFRGLMAIYKISRKTGDILFRLGGKHNDFKIGTGAKFFSQHDARWLKNGQISVFDNGDQSRQSTSVCARGLVLDLDENDMRVTLAREYRALYNDLAEHQGSMQVLPNGNAFVGFGARPIWTEYSPSGQAIYDVQYAAKDAPARSVMSYRIYKSQLPWIATPKRPPRVVCDGEFIYVSWNGATTVAEWQVLGMKKPNGAIDVQLISKTEKDGFETVIPVDDEAKKQDILVLAAVSKEGKCLTIVAFSIGEVEKAANNIKINGYHNFKGLETAVEQFALIR